MKVAIIADHYPISPRINKVRNSILKFYPSSEVFVLAWNRENKDVHEDYVISYKQDIGYGNSVKKMRSLFKYFSFVKKEINKQMPTHLHAIDVENLVIAAFLKKDSRLVYEIYDIKFFNNKLINRIRETIEFFLISYKIDGIIYASPFFHNYYEPKMKKDRASIILNNKPNSSILRLNKDKYRNRDKKTEDDKFVIGFIGTIRYKKIIENLITVVKNNDKFVLLLAGYGPDYNEIKNIVHLNDLEEKVVMTGRYELENLNELYKSCDIIWAAYPNENLNVKYAVSNKYFEAQVFDKKIVVSKDTYLANEVVKKQLGYSVDPYDIKEIENLFLLAKDSIHENKYSQVLDNKFWDNEEERIKVIYD